VGDAYARLADAGYRKRPGFTIDSLLTAPGAVETIVSAVIELGPPAVT
jgi:hypothetical protein